MAKTITMRIDEDSYELFKKAAQGARRTIPNFLEFAANSFLSKSTYVSDTEMKDILKDKELLCDLKKGEREIKESKYTIVG